MESTKRIKARWFTADNGKLTKNIFYDARRIKLTKGKSSIQVGNTDQMLLALELIKRAVESDNIDTQIEVASNKLREGFHKGHVCGTAARRLPFQIDFIETVHQITLEYCLFS